MSLKMHQCGLKAAKIASLIISLTMSLSVHAGAPKKPTKPVLDSRGGGSSTGGGHVRMCFTPSGATKVRNNIVLGSQSPQLGLDALAGIVREEITSVDLLDLLEQPAYSPAIQKALQEMLPAEPVSVSDETGPVGVLTSGLYTIAEALQATGYSVFDPKHSYFVAHAVDIASNTKWTASSSGLALTRDFDPKISNKENCVFVQAVRQEVVSKDFRTLIYDERVVALMSPPQLAALGLHEAIYNYVLNSPRRDRIENTSVLTRQLTTLMLMLLTNTEPDIEAIAWSLESIGYGPFLDMVRPWKRMSPAEFDKYINCKKPFVCKIQK